MSSKIRSLVNRLQKEQNAKALLPEYIEQTMQLYDGYARIKMMMEYYVFYEVISEGINPYAETAQETIQSLNQVIGQVYTQSKTTENIASWQETLLSIREDVIRRMQVLTGYVDCFVIYEYILNRIQYRFEEQEKLPEDTEFAQEVMNFIFGSQDNTAIHDNLRMVIGQLPMRMTRKHYYDLVRDCISVYKGSEASSLEGFIYMFRTSAMLYHIPEQEEYFTEFAAVLEELAQVDYENMDRRQYEIYAEKIRIHASKLNDLSDLYMLIGQLINNVYTMITADRYIHDRESMPPADNVAVGIHALFTDTDSPIWQQADSVPVTEEDKMMWLGEQMAYAEGRQEKFYEAITVAEAALEEIENLQKPSIGELGLQPAFAALHELSVLNSNSVFAALQEEADTTEVTTEMAEAEAEKLVTELKALFQGQSRMFRRAVMAETVEKLPTFFSSAQEVADYIMNSLNQCDDAAEKYASKQLIWDMIHM